MHVAIQEIKIYTILNFQNKQLKLCVPSSFFKFLKLLKKIIRECFKVFIRALNIKIQCGEKFGSPSARNFCVSMKNMMLIVQCNIE